MPAPEDDIVEGYLDGLSPDNPEPSNNRSAGYRHGFANGRDDLRKEPRDSAANLRLEANAIIEQAIK